MTAWYRGVRICPMNHGYVLKTRLQAESVIPSLRLQLSSYYSLVSVKRAFCFLWQMLQKLLVQIQKLGSILVQHMLMTVPAQFGPEEFSNFYTRFRKSHHFLQPLTFLSGKDPSVKVTETIAQFSATNVNLSSTQVCFNKTGIARMSKAKEQGCTKIP